MEDGVVEYWLLDEVTDRWNGGRVAYGEEVKKGGVLQ